MVAGARKLLTSETALALAQAECTRFVNELHDNGRETDAFLAGLNRRP